MPLQFEWDDDKDKANRAKHGIGFQEAAVIFTHPLVTAQDDRRDYGEKRFISYGRIGKSIVFVVVHTRRLGRIRLISARKANRKERRAYYEYLTKTDPGN